MIWTIAAGVSLAIWIGLMAFNGSFWLARERDDCDVPPAPATWPDVVTVVPARDEADVIARSIGSLLAQDYEGTFRIVLVDDDSRDGTGEIARALGSERLTILGGAPLPHDWTGKLWALHQGIAAAGTPTYLWLTDADIEHAPDALASLVARAEAEGRLLVSLMAKLHCRTLAERALIPAFVFFFQMLYPFARVNGRGRTAAAAGGCVLVRGAALSQAGGVAAMRGALIDDCTLGAMINRQGPIWLGLTGRSRSIRPYPGFGAVATMIARSAYAQLRYSPLLLAGTLIGLAITYAVPVAAALFTSGLPRLFGLVAWASMALAFQPMLRFYRRSPLWGIALPAIAAFYAACTLLSAASHWQGRGGMWKGRAQGGR